MSLDIPGRFSLALAAVCGTCVAAMLADATPLIVGLTGISGLTILGIAFAGASDGVAPSLPDAIASEPEEAVFDALADPALLLSGSNVVYANAAASALLGTHLIGQDVRIGLRNPAVATMLANPERLGIVEIADIGSGGQIWEIRIERASCGRRLVHMVDRTARHAAERARVDFVANASHELRTPLATLLGYIETLADDEGPGDDKETRQRFLGIMDSEAKRMQRLVSDLMSLSRIEAEKHAFPESDVNLAELLRRVAGERRHDVTLDIAEGVPPVKGDTIQLSQLAHNLIDNAVKYGREGDPARVSLGVETDGRIRLAFSDRGEGIAPQHIPRLTERFYRVDPGRSRAGGGTGLGLSIVKHITEHHRGVLKIDSKPGSGTCVSVSFPANGTGFVTNLSLN